MTNEGVENEQKRRHRAVVLTTPEGTSAAIDIGLAPVIQHLWGNHVATLASCEAYPDGRAHILFGSAADLERAVVALHRAAPADIQAYALMRSDEPSDWAVNAWAKLWFEEPAPSPHPLDGPGPLYYELTLPAAHATRISNHLSRRRL